MTTKLCVDCEHYRVYGPSELCQSPLLGSDLVNGRPRTVHAALSRMFDRGCGPLATNFEPKKPPSPPLEDVRWGFWDYVKAFFKGDDHA